MQHFNDQFFSELSELGETSLYCKGGSDTIMLDDLPAEVIVSEMLGKGKLSKGFADLTARFAAELAVRSNWRFIFERNFRVKPYQVCTHSKGRIGRKQLHIGFDAIPSDRMIYRDWGVSIGLGFDFWPGNVISQKCVADYEEFWTKVSDEPEQFDETFLSMGGYAEPLQGFCGPVSAEVALNSIPNILQPWLFYGKRMSFEEILAMDSLEGFVDECIGIFDLICRAGFYDSR